MTTQVNCRNLPPRAPRPALPLASPSKGKGKAAAAAITPAQEGPFPPEPQSAVRALLAAAAPAAPAAPAGAAAAAADTEDDEPGPLPGVLFSRRLHHTLEKWGKANALFPGNCQCPVWSLQQKPYMYST